MKIHRLLAGTFALLLIAGVSSPAFGAVEAVDQSNTTPFETCGGGFGGVGTWQQTFVPDVDNMSAIELHLRDIELPLDNTDTIVRIYQGIPAGVLLGQSSTSVDPVPFADVPTLLDFTRFEFDPHLELAPGENHYIEVTKLLLNDKNWACNSGDQYPDGSLWGNDEEANPDADFLFITYFWEDEIVGGELLSIDSTALILAGAQSFSWMIPVVLSILGIGLFTISRKSENS